MPEREAAGWPWKLGQRSWKGPLRLRLEACRPSYLLQAHSLTTCFVTPPKDDVATLAVGISRTYMKSHNTLGGRGDIRKLLTVKYY